MKRDYHFGDYHNGAGSFYIMDDMGNAHMLNDSEFNQNEFFYVDYFGTHLTYWD
ncbi:hypothetical protein [Chryseobacterium sp.]|uniref:hypothetical protein n=1 Tax=Chryseobacterium sp. TaxID=1871047 RepID=UPI00321B7C69